MFNRVASLSNVCPVTECHARVRPTLIQQQLDEALLPQPTLYVRFISLNSVPFHVSGFYSRVTHFNAWTSFSFALGYFSASGPCDLWTMDSKSKTIPPNLGFLHNDQQHTMDPIPMHRKCYQLLIKRNKRYWASASEWDHWCQLVHVSVGEHDLLIEWDSLVTLFLLFIYGTNEKFLHVKSRWNEEVVVFFTVTSSLNFGWCQSYMPKITLLAHR